MHAWGPASGFWTSARPGEIRHSSSCPAYPSDLAEALGISRTRLSNHLACLRDCGLVVTVPDGRRTRYELADERLGTALDDLRSAVVAVETDRTCPDAETEGCC
ncbi:helix-turn-helix domain-containing protein [Streptomyces durocortorensis]|uniref:helix-turn-helix domain-containing protein n=1 Tax=Streptomyces durocortorensis TaxID=2811104 RepID=UPI0027DDE307|nr:helix-turn-helix domain-containing protein [Streptomyces durocortorensis]